MAEALIAAADENNDGKLQFEEFKRAIKIVAEGQSS
jgi:Ca2+-binding EF-hand superfamily protein